MNPARPLPGVRLCALDEIEDPGAKGFTFQVEKSWFLGFLVRLGDEVFGYIDQCPHNGFPLAASPDKFLTREKDLILCGAHGALFKIGDGACVAGPCYGKHLPPWPIALADGAVFTAEG